MNHRRKRMTEIFATLGPACQTRTILASMIRLGMTGVRLNLSHATLRESAALLNEYREACAMTGVRPEILIDLQGPCQRLGPMRAPLTLESGQHVLLSSRQTPTGLPALCIPETIMEHLREHDVLMIRDGQIRIAAGAPCADAPGMRTGTVLAGGLLSAHQSVKIQDREIYGPLLTQSDLESLDLARAYGITSVMQPFVRCADDLRQVKAAMRERNLSLRLFAKIETLTGYAHLEEIMPEADTVVIARGDLGNCVPLWELPRLQKDISRRCRKANVPFMVVTQMLKSMESAPIPTRAEVSDIFNAVLDGASSVMITSESAVGMFPEKAVEYLSRTVREAEMYLTGSAAL